MTNNQIAQFLYEISEMLEIKGENSFRVNAYQRAGRAIELLADEVEGLYRQGGVPGLEKIPGVGESIALKIAELVDTGKCKYYDDLAKQIPKEELVLMKIPGIGAKTAKKLYQELKIKSLEDLEKAAKEGKIRALPGFEAKTEENILKNITRLKKREKRMLISFAEPIAREIKEYLLFHPSVKKAETVGSLRRMKETIGDIDIVVASSNPEETIDHFIKAPFVKEVIGKGDTKAAILHQKEDTHIDLEILDPKNWGSLLQHLTGSKDHNIHLRRYANDIGLSLSEYGILNLKTKKKKVFAEEKDFYKRLKMDYIEPELREDQGEIEAAINHKLPKLIKLEDVKGDFHIHTKWSEGAQTIEEVTKEALKRGYRFLAICDHSKGLGITKGIDEEKALEQIEEIKKINQKFPQIKLLSGVEVNIKANSELDLKDRILEKLDFVIASIHSSFEQSEEVITKRVLTAISNPNVDAIGHPSGRLIGRREELNIDWPLVFQKASKTKTLLEINCHAERLDLKDTYIRDAKKYGCKFVIGTDTHRPEHFDLIRYGVAMARRGWLEKGDVINAWDLEKILEWKK